MSGNTTRVQTIHDITKKTLRPPTPIATLESLWATDVYTLEKMKEHLPKEVFKSLKKTIETGAALDVKLADVVAAAMKEWAVSKGALYYSHVFYPLTNATAEKHDGFISTQSDGTAISEFSGKLLVQGEPDGSSFPNGGIRGTSHARGYTAWDITSPAYIVETSNGATLCIPTVFVSWTGEALDKKTPLLRSIAAMNKAAKRVLTVLGNKEIAQVNSSAGPEQEYFLVDLGFANARPDLVLAGRTLFGKAPAKAQQFDDHYFGVIPERVQIFMQEVEERMYRLGIPAKTRHNEVAPGQFEIAPIFEAANVASDHQQMTMTILRQTAKRHGFMCLLHEKPFAGINGSGKHVNWSVGNATQGNLLDPGDTPHDNIQFLVFCGAVIRMVHKYGALMRAVVATASNDHRLGANEAPPAIMSVYLGTQLEDIFKQIQKGSLTASKARTVMNLGVDSLPIFAKDAGDRNRTSPFAFTGNRFEFRAVGGSQSISGPLVALNTMLAESLTWVAEKLEAAVGSGTALPQAVVGVLKVIMDEHGNVVFGGNGYSAEWHKEAEARGLPNLPSCVEALPVFKEKYVEELFSKFAVLTPAELASRYEVYAEQYIRTIEVEARLAISIAKTQIYPAAVTYLTHLNDALGKAAHAKVELSPDQANKVAGLVKSLSGSVAKLGDALGQHDFATLEAHLAHAGKTIKPLMDEVRKSADALEAEVADSDWPLPSYTEMLFIK